MSEYGLADALYENQVRFVTNKEVTGQQSRCIKKIVERKRPRDRLCHLVMIPQ